MMLLHLYTCHTCDDVITPHDDVTCSGAESNKKMSDRLDRKFCMKSAGNLDEISVKSHLPQLLYLVSQRFVLGALMYVNFRVDFELRTINQLRNICMDNFIVLASDRGNRQLLRWSYI